MEQNISAGDRRDRRQDAHDALTYDGFTGAGFADKRDRPPLRDAERHPVDRPDFAFGKGKFDREVVDFQNGAGQIGLRLLCVVSLSDCVIGRVRSHP